MCIVSYATSRWNILKRSHMYFSGIVLFPWLSCGYIWLYLVLYLCHEELQNISDVSSCIVPKYIYNCFPKSSLRNLHIYSRHAKSPPWLYLGGLLILKEARQCTNNFQKNLPTYVFLNDIVSMNHMDSCVYIFIILQNLAQICSEEFRCSVPKYVYLTVYFQ